MFLCKNQTLLLLLFLMNEIRANSTKIASSFEKLVDIFYTLFVMLRHVFYNPMINISYLFLVWLLLSIQAQPPEVT